MAQGTEVIKIFNGEEAVAFVEKDDMFLEKTLQETRETLRNEVGDLLPRYFLFLKWNIPVGSLQEKSIKLKNILESHNKGGEDNSHEYRLSIKTSTTNRGTHHLQLSEVEPEGHNPSSMTEQLTPSSSTTRPTLPGAAQPLIAIANANSGKTPAVVTVNKLKDEILGLKECLSIENAKLESLKTTPPPRPWVGNSKFTCNNCHNRGHKVTSPCRLPPCEGYHVCGIINHHKEHKELINQCLANIKHLGQKIKDKEADLSTLSILKDRTKANFFSVMRPRLIDSNPVKYSDRSKLNADLMQLAAAFKHKVPEKDTYVDYEAIISQQKSKSAKFFTAKPTNQLNTPTTSSFGLQNYQNATAGRFKEKNTWQVNPHNGYSWNYRDYQPPLPSPRYGTSTSTKAQSQEAVRGKQINFGNSSPANPYLQGYRGRSVQYSQSHKRTHPFSREGSGYQFRKNPKRHTSSINHNYDDSSTRLWDAAGGQGGFLREEYQDQEDSLSGTSVPGEPCAHSSPLEKSSYHNNSDNINDNSWSKSKRLPDSFVDNSCSSDKSASRSFLPCIL